MVRVCWRWGKNVFLGGGCGACPLCQLLLSTTAVASGSVLPPAVHVVVPIVKHGNMIHNIHCNIPGTISSVENANTYVYSYEQITYTGVMV